jgi:hypothetical protein
MAYVRRTDKLMSDICSKIYTMCRKAQSAYASGNVEVGHPVHEEMKTAALAQAWELNPSLRNSMPKEWCYYTRQINLHFLDDADRVVFRTTIQVPVGAELRLPCKTTGSYIDTLDVEAKYQSDTLREWIAAEDERKRESLEIQRQYDEVLRQIKAFMSTKTSLNAALKEMPELELYVPDEYMQKFHEPTATRANKSAAQTQPDVEIDRNQIAALGVAHRIATAAE